MLNPWHEWEFSVSISKWGWNIPAVNCYKQVLAKSVLLKKQKETNETALQKI